MHVFKTLIIIESSAPVTVHVTVVLLFERYYFYFHFNLPNIIFIYVRIRTIKYGVFYFIFNDFKLFLCYEQYCFGCHFSTLKIDPGSILNVEKWDQKSRKLYQGKCFNSLKKDFSKNLMTSTRWILNLLEINSNCFGLSLNWNFQFFIY